MNILGKLKPKKTYAKNDFSDFVTKASSAEKKKVILSAVKKANKMQKDLLSKNA